MYKKIKILSNISLLLLFLFTISSTYIFYGLEYISLIKSVNIVENRKLNNFPKIKFNNIAEFPKNFDSYFKDNFGFRNQLIRLHNYVMIKIFKISPIEKYILGKNEWLYYRAEVDGNGYSIKDFRGLMKYKEKELFKICTALSDREKWCQNHNIEFIAIIPPTKVTIYPEFLPSYVNKVSLETRLDQLLKFMKNNCNFEIIDLREILQNQKGQMYNLYFKGGTHWNQLGAYFGYREIMNRLAKKNPIYKPYKLSDFNIKITNNSKYDSGSELITDKYIEMKLKKGIKIRRTPNILLTFSDSFTQVSLLPFLKLHFTEININDNFGLDLKKSWLKEKPNVVLYEALERNQHELINLPTIGEINIIEKID